MLSSANIHILFLSYVIEYNKEHATSARVIKKPGFIYDKILIAYIFRT